MTSLKTFSFFLCLVLLVTTPLVAGEDVRKVQQALTDRGYDPGPVDGLMGPRTRRAIESFQRDQDLPVNGRMDGATLRALGVDVPLSVTIPAGTVIEVLLNQGISSATANPGDTFSMTVVRSVEVDGHLALPARSTIWGKVTEVERAKRPQKGGRLGLSATGMTVNDQRISIGGMVTAPEARLKGKGSLKQDWKKIAIGAGVGAVVGGVAGGGKGVAAGLAIGGGGVFLATKGEQVNLPAETRLIVELDSSVVVNR